MDDFESVEGVCYEWSSSGREGSRLRRPAEEFEGNARKRRGEQEHRETPEQMIRELQGIFCKGRYRSWVPSMTRPRDRQD